MRAAYVNETISNDLTASSFAPGFPVTNIQISRMSRKWRGFSAGATTIEVDGQHTADMVCVNAHNFVSGDTMTLKGYSDAGRTVLDTTVVITVRDYGTAELFTSKNLYWTFEFNTASVAEIGGLFLGQELILPSYEIGHTWSQHAGDDVFVSKTKQLYGLNAFQYRSASYLIPHTEWDAQADIAEMYRIVGMSNPWYLLQFPDRQDLRPLFYCRFTDNFLKWQEHEKNIQVYKDLPVNIEEVF